MKTDVLRQSRYFTKLLNYLMEHPDVKPLLCRIRLLWYHIHSKKSTFEETKRVMRLHENHHLFSDSLHQQRVKLAHVAVKDAENILSNVQSSLQSIIGKLVRDRLQHDPDYHPISLIDKFASVTTLQHQKKFRLKKPHKLRPQSNPLEKIRRIIELQHGPTPTSERLVTALYQSLKVPKIFTTSNNLYSPFTIGV